MYDCGHNLTWSQFSVLSNTKVVEEEHHVTEAMVNDDASDGRACQDQGFVRSTVD